MARARILIVDDEAGIRTQYRLMFEAEYEIFEAAEADACLELLGRMAFDLVLLDQILPGMVGLELLGILKRRAPETEVLMVSALDDSATAVKAIKAGAFYYVTKGGDPAEVRRLVRAALEQRLLKKRMTVLESELEEYRALDLVPSRNLRMREILEVVRKIAAVPANVLVTGESGTGKELIARQIYAFGGDDGRPFVRVNMAAIPRELVESTLFGHEKGAFTSAVRQQIGKFELADGGVLFLDEIGELPLDLQSKLLRVLQEGEFERVGGARPLRTRVRLIAATNRDLEEAVAKGAFREDLYYRLRVIPIALPPLRERAEDIPALAEHFLRKYAARFGRPVRAFSPAALAVLEANPWPGNVRELENLISRIVAMVDRPEIDVADIPVEYQVVTAPAAIGGNMLQEAVDAFERTFIRRTLSQAGDNRTEAARRLGIPLSTLKYKLNRLGIKR